MTQMQASLQKDGDKLKKAPNQKWSGAFRFAANFGCVCSGCVCSDFGGVRFSEVFDEDAGFGFANFGYQLGLG